MESGGARKTGYQGFKRGVVSVYELPAETRLKVRRDAKKTRVALQEAAARTAPRVGGLAFLTEDEQRLDQDADLDDDHIAVPSSQQGGGSGDSGDSGDSRESNEEDEEDEDELMRELEKIKRERAERQAQAEQAQKEADAQRWNPLMNREAAGAARGYAIQRRWDDDVVFKDCARNEYTGSEKRFINDPVRNDFHKNFMRKYMQ